LEKLQEHLPNENLIRHNLPNSPNILANDSSYSDAATVTDRPTSGLALMEIRKADVLSLLGSHVQETNVRLKDLEGRLVEIISRIEMKMAKEETLAEVRQGLSENIRRQEDLFKTSAQEDLEEARKRFSNAKISLAKHQILEVAREQPVNNKRIVELGIVKHLSTASSYLNALAQMGLLERLEQGKYRAHSLNSCP
jgi:DNA-binding transcriptional ArsR family regulator